MASGKAIALETCRALESGKYRVDGVNVNVTEPTTRGVILQDAPPYAGAERRDPAAAPSALSILSCGSFEAARWLLDRGSRRVVVLDFASDSEPGGGWRGNQQGTQEESLCRASSLGRALEKLDYPIPAYGMAHVPEVVVIRDDSGALLSRPFSVGVLAAALRDVGGDGEPSAKQQQHLERKVDGVLAAAASFGYDAIVLGSWGCGAFGNEVALVARAIASALAGRFASAFAAVAYADPRKPGREAFYNASKTMGAVCVGPSGGTSQDTAKAQSPPAVNRHLSESYGAGASRHSEEVLQEWMEEGVAGAEAARQRDWRSAEAHFERCVALRPEWEKGVRCLERARQKRAGAAPVEASGAEACSNR